MTCKASDPDTVRSALKSWIGVEILTPGIVQEGGWNGYAQAMEGQLRNRATQAQTGQSLWEAPEDDDIAPWFAEVETKSSGDFEPIMSPEEGALPRPVGDTAGLRISAWRNARRLIANPD